MMDKSIAVVMIGSIDMFGISALYLLPNPLNFRGYGSDQPVSLTRFRWIRPFVRRAGAMP